MMPMLAEISDKIALPHHNLIIGVFLGCLCLLGTVFFAGLCRRLGLVFFVVFAALLALWTIKVPPVDIGLAAQAEREIPGYHRRMYVALFTPLLPALVLSLAAAGLTPNWIRRARRRGRNQCEGCGYSLDGLQTGQCPECGYWCTV